MIYKMRVKDTSWLSISKESLESTLMEVNCMSSLILLYTNTEQRETKNWTFGRTDSGEMGMKAFFDSHKCTDACKLLGLNEVDTEKVCRKSTRR